MMKKMDMFAKPRIRSAYASMQSDQSLLSDCRNLVSLTMQRVCSTDCWDVLENLSLQRSHML